MLESDLRLHRAVRDHFQLEDDEDIDFELFDHLVRKIVSLANAFTGMETLSNISLQQAQMLMDHPWPVGGAKVSKNAAKQDMIKEMLGKGKKQKSDNWVSPFGSHFPNPKKKSGYAFYHATYCPETGTYRDADDDLDVLSESESESDTDATKPELTDDQKLWKNAKRMKVHVQA